MEYKFHYLCGVKLKDAHKEELIMKATLDLVAQGGLAGITMAAIGKAARLGMGTMYVYFKSKEELINVLYKKLKQENTKRILDLDNVTDPYPVMLKRVWINYVKDRIEHHKEHFFIDQCTNSHFLDRSSKTITDQTFGAFHELLDAGKKQFLVKDLDNELLTAHLIGSANSIAALIRSGKRKLDQALVTSGFTLAWDSIKM